MPSKILDLPGSINSKSAEKPLITLTVLLKASWLKVFSDSLAFPRTVSASLCIVPDSSLQVRVSPKKLALQASSASEDGGVLESGPALTWIRGMPKCWQEAE